jgi:DNA-binding NtrC family response regulator
LQNVIEHVAVFASPHRDVEVSDLPSEQDESHALYMGDAEVAAPRPLLDGAYHVAKEQTLARFEEQYVTRLVARAQGNVSRAARLASMDRATLYRLMQRQGVAGAPGQPSFA